MACQCGSVFIQSYHSLTCTLLCRVDLCWLSSAPCTRACTGGCCAHSVGQEEEMAPVPKGLILSLQTQIAILTVFHSVMPWLNERFVSFCYTDQHWAECFAWILVGMQVSSFGGWILKHWSHFSFPVISRLLNFPSFVPFLLTPSDL
jgi:hypothetical protein